MKTESLNAYFYVGIAWKFLHFLYNRDSWTQQIDVLHAEHLQEKTDTISILSVVLGCGKTSIIGD